MRLITPHSLAASGRRLNIDTMSLNLTERSSTANVAMADLSGVKLDDMVTGWFLDDEAPGKNIVWRARNISRAYHSDACTIQLEHIINVLRDTIIFGEVKTETISAWAGKDKNAKKVSAMDAIKYALSFQKDWVLGSFDYADEMNPYAFDGDTVYDALEYVSASLDEAFWSYDMLNYPFRINITNNSKANMPKNSQSIMRAGRNLNTITRNIDKSGMYTRFYATGKDDLKMEFGKAKTPYRDRNTDKYGIIEHAESDNSLTTQEQLQFWALTKLRKHDAPVVTIDVDGLELADATGESVDRFTLGLLCKVPLPEFGTTIEEKIVGLSYPDKKNQPESVKVSLSNKREDVTKIIAQQTQAARRSSRVQQRQNKSTMEIVRNTIKEVQIAGPDSNNQYKLQYKLVTDTNWKDAPVNFSRAVTSWNVKKVADGQIRVTAKPQEQYKDLYVRAGTITREKDKAGKDTNIYSGPIQYSENKSAWSSTGAKISVNATASYNDGRTFGIDEGRDQVYVKRVALATGYSYLNDTGERTVVEIEGTSGIKDSTAYDKTLEKPFKLAQTKYNSQSSYCVELLQWNASDRAYTDKVGRVNIDNVWQLGWNAGNEAGQDSVTVDRIALADNYSFLGDTRGDIRWQVYIQGTASNGAKKDNTYFTLTTQTYVNRTRYCAELRQWNSTDHAFTDIIGRIDIHSIYETGKTDGKPIGWREANDALQMPAAGTNEYTDFVVPSSNYNQTVSYRYTVSCDSNYVYLKNAVNTVVARKAHTLYADGWRAANDALEMPQAATNEYMDVVVPSSNVEQTVSYRYTITSDSSYLYIKNAVNTVVARKAHTLYSDGWKAANDALQMPRASTESFMDVIVPSSNVHQTSAYRYITDFDDNYVYIKIYGVNTVVARKSHTLYRDGWRAANDVVEPPSASTKAYMDIVVPAYNVGSTSSYRYSLDFDNDYVYIKNAVNTVVSRKSHTLYRDGWRAANDVVVMPAGQTANAYMDVVVPSSNVNQTSSYRYTVSASGGKTYIKNAVGTVVAQGTYPTPDYDVDFIGTGTFQSSVSPASALAGWNPEQITGVGDSQMNMYRFIKFKVDGKQRSFYFA